MINLDKNLSESPDQNAHVVSLLMEQNELLKGQLSQVNELLQLVQKENTELKMRCNNLEARCKELEGQNSSLKIKHDEMNGHYQWLERQMFGKKSERYIPEPVLHMNDLFNLGGESDQVEPDDEKPKEKVIGEHTRKVGKKKSSKLQIGETVSTIENLIDIPEDERTCPVTGELYKKIGEDRKEQLYIVPSKVCKLITVRPKYANTIETPVGPKTQILQAKPEPELLRGSKFHYSFLVYLIVQKFVFHIPLNRIIEDMKNKDVGVSSQALSGTLIAVAAKFKILFELMEKELFKQKHLFTDDTGAKMLLNKSAPAKKTYVWIYIGGDPDKPQYMIYKHTLGHSEDIPREHLSEFSGCITADAFGGYVKLDRDPNVDIKWNACWDHGRRKFEPYISTSPLSKFMLDNIRELSMNERECWNVDAKQRQQLRDELQKPLVDKIFDELNRVNDLGGLTPKNKVQVGINYFINNEINFRRFLTDPKLKIENNTSEHGARKVVIGRNNWMFFGSKRGADAGCLFMSFTQTCRRMDINPTDYLTYVFRRLPTISETDTKQMRELLPHIWKKNNPTSIM